MNTANIGLTEAEYWVCDICGHRQGYDRTECANCHGDQDIAAQVLFGLTDKERATQAMGATMYSNESLEYYTPQHLTDAARRVMGSIDLDPASCDTAQAWINAGEYYTIDDDGFEREWFGNVWLNPPYSYRDGKSNQMPWSSKLGDEYDAGRVTSGVLLVKAALGYNWFEELWDRWPVCFLRERVSFIMPNGDDSGQSKQATAIFYLGDNTELFIKSFAPFGRVVLSDGGSYVTR